MKKFLLFIGLVLLSSALAWAQETFSYGDLTFRTTTSSTSVYVTGVSAQGASSTTIYIPSAVYYNGSNHRVWGISDNAFKNNTTVKSVVFNWGARIIGQSSFYGCTNLTEVHLSSSVARIDASAFAGCTSLQKVYYSSFDFPSLSCQASSWPSNSGMTLYISPLSEKTPDEWLAATGWNKFSSAVKSGDACDYHLEDGGQYAVGSSDTDGVDVLRNLTLVGYKKPSRVSGSDPTEGGTVYRPMSNIVDGGISFHFTRIGTGALYNMTALKKIDLSYAIFLKTINERAFMYCSALTTLKLPASVTSIIADSFVNFCPLLGSIDVDADNPTYATYDGMLFNKSLTRLYRVPEGYPAAAVSYPSTLETVSTWAHYRCANIQSSCLPYGVRTIGNYAYHSATNLTSVVIPSSVTSLGKSGVFAGTSSLTTLWLNMPTPPTITASSYFANPSNVNLHIPYGTPTQNAYTEAGWTGFATVNNLGEQAFDISSSDNYCYTVTSNANTTVNGTTYDGRVKLVSAGAPSNTSIVVYTIPASVTYNDKTYAVTMIGEQAFNNHDTSITHTNLTVNGCQNIDTIGDYAFYNQPLAIFDFTSRLRHIGNYAFNGVNMTGTVALPYGVRSIGMHAFANGKYSRFVMPNSVSTFYGTFCKNTTTLTELIINKSSSTYYNYTGWDLGTVPDDCYIRVPVGVVNQYKQNSKFSSRANYITAGAYDFARLENYTGYYYFSILSTTSVTYNGTTYAGKAKYVYHPNIKNTTLGYDFQDYAVDRVGKSQYLITEIGDSCFAGAQFSNSYLLPGALTRIGDYAFYNSAYAKEHLTLPSGLTYLGREAFYNSKITGEVKIPASVTQIGSYALFTNTLSSIYFYSSMPTIGSYAWSPNISGNVWVPNEHASSYLTTANLWSTPYGDKLAVWIKPNASSVPFSSVLPTDLSGSNIYAFIATAYDKSTPTQQLTMTQVNQAAVGTGMILAGLTANQVYRIKRPTGTVSAPATNYLVGTPSSSVRIDQQTVGYYWDGSAETPHFIKPTAAYTSTIGQAYLKLTSTQASGVNEVYTNLWPKPSTPGDVNGDNTVDVNDVNIIINIILGKASTSEYAGNADVTGDDTVDVNDVNAVINIILGKA